MRSHHSIDAPRVRRRLRALRRDRRGAVGVLFALTLLPAFMLIAMTVDYSAGVAQAERVQDALDSAVLAGANSSNPSTTAATRIAAAAQMFQSTIGSDRAVVTNVTFAVDAASSKISGVASMARKSQFGAALAPTYYAQLRASALPTANLVRALDVALCVDATGSMSNTLSAVQNNITNFKSNLDAAISKAGYRPFDRTRVRVIYYRDFGGNGWLNLPGYSYYARSYGFSTPVSGSNLGDNPALIASGFYDMSSSSDLSSFKKFVSGQYATGGGDLPESGLECLWTAMNSAWTKAGDALSNGAKATDVFPVVSIYTDAGAHPPAFTWSTQNPHYPSAMPTNFADLLAQWNNASVIDQTHKTLLFYGDPTVEDDYFFGNTSGWETVRTWPNFSNPASLTSANNDFVTSLARGIVGTGSLRLTD